MTGAVERARGRNKSSNCHCCTLLDRQLYSLHWMQTLLSCVICDLVASKRSSFFTRGKPPCFAGYSRSVPGRIAFAAHAQSSIAHQYSTCCSRICRMVKSRLDNALSLSSSCAASAYCTGPVAVYVWSPTPQCSQPATRTLRCSRTLRSSIA